MPHLYTVDEGVEPFFIHWKIELIQKNESKNITIVGGGTVMD